MQGRQTRQRTVDSPFCANGVTTFDSYRSDLHRAAPNTCPGAPCVLWAGTVPRAGESLLCSLHGERGTLGRWGRRILAALAPAAAAELRLNPALASPRNPSVRHLAHSLWPVLALKPAEHRAGGLRWPGVCQGLQSGFPGVCFEVWQAQGGPGTVSPSALSPA